MGGEPSFRLPEKVIAQYTDVLTEKPVGLTRNYAWWWEFYRLAGLKYTRQPENA
nr:hypothetical protein [uncultured Kingella sp.]